MALKDIFKMTKANRYTADGREELIKAQEAEVEDRRYKIGEISEKTGLQKTANGWVKPNKGGKPAEKTDVSGAKVLNNKYYKNDVRTEAGEKKILSETKTEVLQNKVKELEDLKKKNGGKLGTQGEKSLQLAKEELSKRSTTKSTTSKPAESTSAPKFKTEQENARYQQGLEGWDDVKAERLPEIKKMVEQKIEYYKNYNPYIMVGKKTGLTAAQKNSVKLNMAQAKENLAFYTGQLEGINKKMGATDSAPRILTGDTRIRVRK